MHQRESKLEKINCSVSIKLRNKTEKQPLNTQQIITTLKTEILQTTQLGNSEFTNNTINK